MIKKKLVNKNRNKRKAEHKQNSSDIERISMKKALFFKIK